MSGMWRRFRVQRIEGHGDRGKERARRRRVSRVRARWAARNLNSRVSPVALCALWFKLFSLTATGNRHNYLIFITRFSAASTQNLFPAGITVVALYSVITAGPLIDRPGTMSPRSNTGVVTVLSRKNTGARSTATTRCGGLRP